MSVATLPQVAWPDALPEWDDYPTADKLEHIETCAGCAICEAHRAWGECRSCGADVEALPPDEHSRCCGSPVVLDSPAEDNYLARAA